MDAVAAGLRADVDHRIADARRLGVEDLVLPADAQREHVHQRVAVVARLEDALAADRGHAEAVAVVRDAGDHAFDDAAVARAVLRIVERAEAQRIHHRDGPRAHGEDVAQDAAHAGGRALERLDEARVVVRFDLEGDHPAVADVDDAGVLARALHHQLAARGQLLQVQARALVGAVLAPHHAEDAELGVARLAAEDARRSSRTRRAVSWCWAISSGVMVAVMVCSAAGGDHGAEARPGRRSSPSAARWRAPGAASCRARCARG